MAQKTLPTQVSPTQFLKQVESEQARKDARELMALMKEITGASAKMWGPSIIGFGAYHYKYASGHEGDAPLIGFSPRKPSLVIYLAPYIEAKTELAKLGKHKMGKGCLYIKTLADVDRKVLKRLLVRSVKELRERYSA